MPPAPDTPGLRVVLAQIAPVLLDRAATLAKVTERVREAASLGCRLVAFGEACWETWMPLARTAL